jgi:hypothetical protein
MAFFLLYTALNMNAQDDQFLYYDFEPDSVACIKASDYIYGFFYFYLDIDQDGDVHDVAFSKDSKQYIYAVDGVYPTWEVAKIVDTDTAVILSDLPVEPINPCWMCFLGSHIWGWEPNLLCQNVKVGVKKIVGEDSYYGWINAYVKYNKDPELADTIINGEPLNTVIIDKMAFCKIPNYPLRWGQKSLDESVEENTYNPVAIYPDPTDGVLNISFSENTDCQSVEIYAIDGRLLKSQISNLETVDMSSFESGLYIIKVRLADGREFTERIVKE